MSVSLIPNKISGVIRYFRPGVLDGKSPIRNQANAPERTKAHSEYVLQIQHQDSDKEIPASGWREVLRCSAVAAQRYITFGQRGLKENNSSEHGFQENSRFVEKAPGELTKSQV
jgi:hypothetical protein